MWDDPPIDDTGPCRPSGMTPTSRRLDLMEKIHDALAKCEWIDGAFLEPQEWDLILESLRPDDVARQELSNAWNEAYCTDDTPLDKGLAAFIADLRRQRDAAHVALGEIEAVWLPKLRDKVHSGAGREDTPVKVIEVSPEQFGWKPHPSLARTWVTDEGKLYEFAPGAKQVLITQLPEGPRP